MSRYPNKSNPLPRHGLLSFGMAFAITLMALPGHAAIAIPDLPLQTGSAYPPPNIMFVLDNSGSMSLISMPFDVEDKEYTGTSTGASKSGLSDNPYDRSYLNNTIYYNPNIVYRPWLTADGRTRMTGGQDVGAVFTSWDLANGDDISCGLICVVKGTRNLKGSDESIFYVPKSGVSPSKSPNPADYTRYRINDSGQIVALGNNGRESPQLPTSRGLSAELTNIATWYSYYRSRMKTAKGGAAEAFSSLSGPIRVGFTGINGRPSGLRSTGTAEVIPVSTDGGLFRGSNKAAWFEQLVETKSMAGSTPLRTALWHVGGYFQRKDAAGPWGVDKQLSCRQSYSILTTDGYWNDSFTLAGDADGTDGEVITSKDGKVTHQYTPSRPYMDYKIRGSSESNTLADVAMYYWKRDLNPDLDNDVPTSAADTAFWQHMVTFGVSIGLKGKLDPSIDLPSIANGSKEWGKVSDGPSKIDDLWHAAVNGRGKFVVASNPTEFAQGLIDAFATVAARTGSASNVTANSTSFQSDTRLYQASYVSGKWSGEVAAYDVSSAGVSVTSRWLASKNIPTPRKIFSWYGDGNGGKGDFSTVAPVTLLARTTGLAAVSGADNRDYLAGESALETRSGGKLRNRDTLLGDIANSSPMYVRDSETIFVGANDGMLHAFNALTGAERFAYVPRGINWAQLANLSDPQYGHHYFVDGPVVVSTKVQTPNKNYLVGALGRGGKGVFGLDVTAPGSFSKQQILWDITGDYAPTNMGQVLGDPLVVTLNGGKKGVIVSNGINSGTGTASLFILDLVDGTVIKELNTGVTGDNGLSAPRGADVDGNGTVDYVYAGDLKGNLWKFDLSGLENTWSIANGVKPMFKATDGAGKAQPITAGVALARNPADGKIWVLFGTGSFMTTADMSNKDIQSMYGVIDEGIVSRSDLVKRNITVETTQDGRNVRAFDPNRPALESGKKGWVIDLDKPTAGERIVSNPRVTGTVLLTASLIPPTTNTCDAGGSGYINAVDVFTGTSVKDPYFDSNGDGQYNDSDKVKDEQGNDLPIGSIDLGVGMPTMPTIIDKLLIVGGSKGSVGNISVNPQGAAVRRLSWREVMGN